MIRHLIGGAKRAFGLHKPGRELDVFPDDIFLVSYPKSGNTWTRFLVANLVYPDKQVDFTNINDLTPDPEAQTKRHLARLPRPRIIKSHQYFDPRYRRVIYIVRDPRDVLLSEYYFDIKRQIVDEGYPIEKYVARFLGAEGGRVYGTWAENVGSWVYVRGNDPGFLLVRYEALQSDGLRELARIAEFLGIARDPQRLALALERSSADRMRDLEKKQAHLWSSTKETRKDRPFVRAAKAGGWRSELPEKCVAALQAAWGQVMKDVGYELSASTVARVGFE
jgi:sulfotransferase family protein